ncbi:MAG: hypothetical protein U0574_03655 [Phycisphaerales bacterium]
MRLARVHPASMPFAASLALLSGCATAPANEGTASFTSVEVSPATVCTNQGSPMVRITWSVSGNRSSHVAILINDRGLPAGPASPGPLGGDGNWSGEENVNLKDFFSLDGQNVPSSVVVRVTLTGYSPSASPWGGYATLDTQERRVTTRNDCP